MDQWTREGMGRGGSADECEGNGSAAHAIGSRSSLNEKAKGQMEDGSGSSGVRVACATGAGAVCALEHHNRH